MPEQHIPLALICQSIQYNNRYRYRVDEAEQATPAHAWASANFCYAAD